MENMNFLDDLEMIPTDLEELFFEGDIGPKSRRFEGVNPVTKVDLEQKLKDNIPNRTKVLINAHLSGLGSY